MQVESDRVAGWPAHLENRDVSKRRKATQWFAGVTVAVIALWLANSLRHKPVLVHTLGEWDCACGEMYIKTTMRVIWNPFRDRQPEIAGDDFLSKGRAIDSDGAIAVCQPSLPAHRVTAWKLSYREDSGDVATLYYKLTKHGMEGQSNVTGVGVIDVRKTPAGWCVAGFDAYF